MIYELILAVTIPFSGYTTGGLPIDLYRSKQVTIGYIEKDVFNTNSDAILRVSKKYGLTVISLNNNFRYMHAIIVDIHDCDVTKLRRYIKELEPYTRIIAPNLKAKS